MANAQELEKLVQGLTKDIIKELVHWETEDFFIGYYRTENEIASIEFHKTKEILLVKRKGEIEIYYKGETCQDLKNMLENYEEFMNIVNKNFVFLEEKVKEIEEMEELWKTIRA
ncbi:MAG: hypothetical protein HFJ53_07795 [Clostridia bacterium]|nr:hypothetical protein [Clostridia bacterium]